MIFKVARLQLHTITYSRENKYKSRHTIKEGSDGYDRKQQEYQNTQR